MRRHLTVIVTVFAVLGLLVVLNAASYVGNKKEEADTELRPNRSTFNAGATARVPFTIFCRRPDTR